jgi:uncharacterized repeat protein (TIGR03803 family)
MKACGVFLLWAATAVALHAQTFRTLHSFDGADGGQPDAGLVQGTDGNLFGTTPSDGAYNGGTFFKITPDGTLTTLHSFDGTDGYSPQAALFQATNGDFYGTTLYGGTGYYSVGTVFTITPSGTLTTLYSFCSQGGRSCTDGDHPNGLVQATDGDFYGTTSQGGANGSCEFGAGCGTVFKMTPHGTLTTLYSFCSQSNCTDGDSPYAGLVQATDGNFYGTTAGGGANGDGTVFKITPGGKLTTLHSFCLPDGSKCTDGTGLVAGLVQGTNGDFYGTTFNGGSYGGGTVFKMTLSGALTTLHSFDGTDGSNPFAALVQGTDGDFYGTTDLGGAYAHGTAFTITPSGILTTLHSFEGRHGNLPVAGLIQATNGVLYGTTKLGGANNMCGKYNDQGCGTVYSLSVGLRPFVETLPTSGKVGARVKILGTSLTGATSVTFNGTAATFTVKSKSEIATTVPAGATTGTVEVVTPGGTLSSNVPFRVKS